MHLIFFQSSNNQPTSPLGPSGFTTPLTAGLLALPSSRLTPDAQAPTRHPPPAPLPHRPRGPRLECWALAHRRPLAVPPSAAGRSHPRFPGSAAGSDIRAGAAPAGLWPTARRQASRRCCAAVAPGAAQVPPPAPLDPCTAAQGVQIANPSQPTFCLQHIQHSAFNIFNIFLNMSTFDSRNAESANTISWNNTQLMLKLETQNVGLFLWKLATPPGRRRSPWQCIGGASGRGGVWRSRWPLRLRRARAAMQAEAQEAATACKKRHKRPWPWCVEEQVAVMAEVSTGGGGTSSCTSRGAARRRMFGVSMMMSC